MNFSVINAPEGNIVHVLVKTRQQDMKGYKKLISLKQNMNFIQNLACKQISMPDIIPYFFLSLQRAH